MLNKSEPYTTTAKPNIDHQHLNKCRPKKMVSKDSIPSWFTIHFGQSADALTDPGMDCFSTIRTLRSKGVQLA